MELRTDIRAVVLTVKTFFPRVYPQCRLSICRKFLFLSLVSETPCLQCVQCIYTYIVMWVSAYIFIRKGEEWEEVEVHTTMSQLNSCFICFVSREELYFQNGVQTLLDVRKIRSNEICNTGRNIFICMYMWEVEAAEVGEKEWGV